MILFLGKKQSHRLLHMILYFLTTQSHNHNNKYNNNKPAAVAAPAPVQQQVAKAIPKVETPGKGANRGATGSLGTSSGAGVAGNAQAGLVGSVNTEVQNDDMLLPYQKV